LYVILDPIHLKGGGTNIPGWATGGADSIDKVNLYSSTYINAIVQKYKNEPKVIAVDLVNEAWQASLNQNRTLSMYNTLINIARAIDPDKILIIEPTWGNSGLNGVNWGLVTDKSNLVFSFHDYYAGGDNDGYDSSGVPQGSFVWNGTSGYNNPNVNQLAANVDTMLGWLSTPALPLYIGEYGIGSSATNHQTWVSDITSVMNARDISRTYWEGCSDGPMALHKNSANTWVSFVDLLAW
jgi:hypothetical protein